MLVLSRRFQEKIFIGENIVITIVEIVPGRVRLGIEAPRDVAIYRQELMPYVVGQIEQRAEANTPANPHAEGGAE
jgi:carbon storage regulator